MDLLFLLFALSAAVAATHASPVGTREKRHASDSRYSWLCPRVVCQPVPRQCRDVERIVFTYSFPAVRVQCESCAYCLDVPAPRVRRAIDAVLAHEPSTHDKHCRGLACPALPPRCQSVKMAAVTLGGHHCRRRCPACFDGTIVNSLLTD